MAVKYVFEWEFVPRKDGKPPKRMAHVHRLYCPIEPCDRCGVFGGAARVRYRGDVHRWNVLDRHDYTTPGLNTLCLGCWNVARSIVRMRDDIEDLGRLARKLEREAQKRGKQDREHAGQPAAGDGAGEERPALAGESQGDGIARAPGGGGA